jgi:hypothetical protein
MIETSKILPGYRASSIEIRLYPQPKPVDMPTSSSVQEKSSNQADNAADNALIASNVNTFRSTKQEQSDSTKPQRCKHCGKFVIDTDRICDVYNVPSVYMPPVEFVTLKT